jgi:hypothetical protein
MPNIVGDYSTAIIDIFKDVVTNYERNLEVIKQTEDELNDINHEIELSAPKDMYKGYVMYKTLRELRLKRRCAKEENELLQEMYEYITSQSGKEFKSRMQKIQGHSVDLYKKQENRTYVPRQRSDLTITDKTCTAYKPFEQMIKEFNSNKAYMQGGKLRK